MKESYEYSLDIEIWEENDKFYYFVIHDHGRGATEVIVKGYADSLEEATAEIQQAVKEVLL